jgi:hypothetical protein
MTDDRGSLRRIVWREVCPWLIIFRCFSLSVSLPVLFLATLGTLLTPAGWKIGDQLFGSQATHNGVLVAYEKLGTPPRAVWPVGAPTDAAPVFEPGLKANVVGVFGQFVAPFAHLVVNRNDLTIREAAYFLWGGLWNILVWGFVAGAITRLAAVRLGRDERIGLREAIGYAGRRYLWYVISPLFPSVFVLAVCVPLALLGGLMRWDAGVLIAGLAWWLVLIGGFIITMILLGLLFGWPLMWPAISSEESADAFDAFSRAYSFTLQRPLHYLFYALVTIAFGLLCWALVSAFCACVVESAYWGASWGAGPERIREVQGLPSNSGLLFGGAFLIRIFTILTHTIAVAFNQSFFWCAATAIYLLLRRDVDETEFDEVFMEGEVDRFALSSLMTQDGETPDEESP